MLLSKNPIRFKGRLKSIFECKIFKKKVLNQHKSEINVTLACKKL
jgi:hypothetical protein